MKDQLLTPRYFLLNESDMRILFFMAITFVIFACNSGVTDKSKNGLEDSAATGSSTSMAAPAKVSIERKNVKSEAVANYSQKIENPLNDWYFKVQLYETPHTFKYLMKIQYEEMNEKDTLKIPNLGFEPKIEIRKGDENYSCIIGFIDNKNEFREYKKVLAKNNTLKVTTLKHYAVYAK